MAAALDIGMGKLVHQHQSGPALKDGVKIHLRNNAALIQAALLGDDLKALGQSLGLYPTMSLTTPMTVSTPSSRRCRPWVSISNVLPTPGAAPRNMRSLPRPSLLACSSRASGDGRSWAIRSAIRLD